LIKTDWDELQCFYNRVFGTKFVSRKAFLKSGYKKFGSIKEFSLKLGISRETLRKQLKQDGIKVKPPRRPRP
jgi:transcriptional regulator of acetoin/glycerol metabolism